MKVSIVTLLGLIIPIGLSCTTQDGAISHPVREVMQRTEFVEKPGTVPWAYTDYSYYTDSEGKEIRHGPSRTCFKGGQPYLTSSWRDGKPFGKWQYYTVEGRVWRESEFDQQGNPKYYRVYHMHDGSFRNEIDYSSGKPVKHGEFYSIACSHGEFEIWNHGVLVEKRKEQYKVYGGAPREGPPAACTIEKYTNGVLFAIESYREGKLIERKDCQPKPDGDGLKPAP